MSYVTFPSHWIFEIWGVLYTDSTSQLGLATSQSHMWLPYWTMEAYKILVFWLCFQTSVTEWLLYNSTVVSGVYVKVGCFGFLSLKAEIKANTLYFHCMFPKLGCFLFWFSVATFSSPVLRRSQCSVKLQQWFLGDQREGSYTDDEHEATWG